MTARQRVVPAGIGLAVFTLLGLHLNHQFWTQWWFYVALAVVVSAAFVEPYFSRPQDAIVNSAAAVGAWAAADRSGVRILWTVLLVFVVTVFVAGMIAALAADADGPRGPLVKSLVHQYSRRFGRAVILGPLVLALETLRLARLRGDSYAFLAIGVGVLIAALGPNWPGIVRSLTNQPLERPTVVASLGPRLLLVQGCPTSLRVGSAVELAYGTATARGWLVAVLPHEHGLRFEVALASDGSGLTGTFPQEVGLKELPHTEAVVGIAGPGTTDLKLVFTPLSQLSIGDPVVIDAPDSTLIYQVSELELRRESWNASAAVVPHAEAIQVGRHARGRLRTHPFLPQAHELIVVPDVLMQVVPAGFVRIGVMKGTEIEIGIDPDAHDGGHFAVLGMSGMGKTAASVRLCRALGRAACVVALDTTGEYQTRLGVPTNVPEGLDGNGFWVHEPAGDPPQKAKEYVQHVMELANAEYRDGLPSRRVLLLEEAHGFIPEWNVATRPQQDATAFTTRMIMQARKFGLRFVIVSQRTAVVSKSALTSVRTSSCCGRSTRRA